MVKKPELPKLTRWDVYKINKKTVWLGTVEAPDKQAAVEKDMAPVCGGAAMTQAVDLDRGRNGWINEFNQKVVLLTHNP